VLAGGSKPPQELAEEVLAALKAKTII